MPVIQDQLWKHPGNPGMIVISSHASLAEDGRLVLSAREELEAKRRIPDIDLQCGQLVQANAVDGVYGFLPVRPSRPKERIIGFGLFQTRLNLDDAPDPELIRFSMEKLRQYVKKHKNIRIRMNFPGIEDESTPAEAVAPLLLPLPDTVTVCHQGQVRRRVPENFTGFKSLYVQVERMLMEGRFQLAVEHLVNSGYDIQSAMEQVRAVERLMRERREREAEHTGNWQNLELFR
jgi:hypothetical protein